MLLICEPVYSTDGITEKEEKVIKDIVRGKKVRGIFCIIFSTNPANLFEIVEAKDLVSPYYNKLDPELLGLAESKEEAELLVKELVKEVFEKTGGFDVRNYFRRG